MPLIYPKMSPMAPPGPQAHMPATPAEMTSSMAATFAVAQKPLPGSATPSLSSCSTVGGWRDGGVEGWRAGGVEGWMEGGTGQSTKTLSATRLRRKGNLKKKIGRAHV